MKTLAALLLAVLLAPGVPTPATPTAPSPLLGTWDVDVARLSMPAAARPQRVTITFSQSAAGTWSTRVEVIDAEGAAHLAQSQLVLDGTPAKVSGEFEADQAAARMPTPEVLVMQLSRQGVPGSTRIYAVARDRRTMVETSAYFGDNGRPLGRVNYFTRVDERVRKTRTSP